jgi:hypothetical protein
MGKSPPERSQTQTAHHADEYRIVPVTDTTAAAAALQLQLLRRAGPAARVKIAVDLSDAVRETTLAGIRRRHPELTESDVKRSFLALVYGYGRRP